MATCGDVTNIRIEPVNVYWKMQEQWCFDFTDMTAAGLGGKYVTLDKPNGGTAYYAWFDENNTDVDPAVVGKTAIGVDYAASAASTAIALAFQTAVDAIAGFKAEVSSSDSNHVIVTCVDFGDAVDFTAGDSSVVVSQLSEGRDFDLGLLQGDVESGFEEILKELTAHQSGPTKIADLRMGVKADATTVLQEVPKTTVEELFAKVAGGSYTPLGGTALHGWGTSRQGDNTIIQAGKLILHPVRLAANDYSEDLCFWRAYPVPETLVFSGENPKTLSVKWQFYKDENVDSKINYFAFGDWTQLNAID